MILEIIKGLWFVILFAYCPYMVGGFVLNSLKLSDSEDSLEKTLNRYVMGFFSMLAIYHVLYLPMYFLKFHLSSLTIVYSIVIVALCAFETYRFIKNKEKVYLKINIKTFSRYEIIYLVLFVLIIVFQFYMFSTHQQNIETNDNHEYVARTTASLFTDEMVSTAETMNITGIVPKRVIASIEIWVASICQITGIKSEIMTFVYLNSLMFLMAYMVIYLISCNLVEDRENKIIFNMITAFTLMFSQIGFYCMSAYFFVYQWHGRSVFVVLILPYLLYEMLEAARNEYIKTLNCIFVILSIASIMTSATSGGMYVVSMTLLMLCFVYGNKGNRKKSIYVISGALIPMATVVLYLMLDNIYVA